MAKSETSRTMSVDFNILCKFIKPYDGDKNKLTSFVRNCNNAFLLASKDHEDLLFKFILSQLEGKAESACSLKQFANWQELKSFLKLTFGEIKHRDHLLLDLQTCKIKPNEDISQYSLRIETCLTRLQTDIYHSTIIKSELEGRIASTEDLALHTFLMGIPSHISTIVRCRNPKTLNEAIDLAIQEEKLQNFIQISKTREKPAFNCNKCGKSGHPTSKCFFNRNINNINTNSRPSTSNQIICNYCKNIGHNIFNCRKREYNNNMKRQQIAGSSIPPAHNKRINFIDQEPDDCKNSYKINSQSSYENLNED